MKQLTGGVLHSKFWVVDGRHVYLGSANMDWRSLAQVGAKARGMGEAQAQVLPWPSPGATVSEERWCREKLASRTLGHTPLLPARVGPPVLRFYMTLHSGPGTACWTRCSGHGSQEGWEDGLAGEGFALQAREPELYP